VAFDGRREWSAQLPYSGTNIPPQPGFVEVVEPFDANVADLLS
jgi:hypothetical protein